VAGNSEKVVQPALNHLYQWLSTAAPKQPLWGPQQSVNQTSNIVCNRLRSAIK